MKYRIRKHELRDNLGELSPKHTQYTIQRNKAVWYSNTWISWTIPGFSVDRWAITLSFDTEEEAHICIKNIKAGKIPYENVVTVIHEESDEAQEGCKSGEAS